MREDAPQKAGGHERSLSPLGQMFHSLSAAERLMPDDERASVTAELFFETR